MNFRSASTGQESTMHSSFENGAAAQVLRTLIAMARVDDRGELADALANADDLKLTTSDHTYPKKGE